MSWTRRIAEVFEWVPIVAAPFVVYSLTDGFSRNLPVEIWVILGMIIIANVAWLALYRWQRRLVDFHAKYPGFGMRK